MPLYEYECDNCGHRFEVIQKFSDPPVDTCPKCGGPVHKLQSAPAFQFKGTGWYITDYAKKDAGAKAEGAGEKAGSSDKDKAATTDKSDKTAKADEKKSSDSGTSTTSTPSPSTPSKNT